MPARQADHGAVLIGEDLACGSPLFDLGWILGEIVELRANTGRTSRAADTVCRLMARALFDGYGASPGPAVRRVATLRSLAHIVDYTSFAGWHNRVVDDHLALLVHLIDGAAMPAVQDLGL